MNRSEFIQAGQKLTGFTHGYQKPLAELIGVSVITVKRYASGKIEIPQPISKLMFLLVWEQDFFKNKSGD